MCQFKPDGLRVVNGGRNLEVNVEVHELEDDKPEESDVAENAEERDP